MRLNNRFVGVLNKVQLIILFFYPLCFRLMVTLAPPNRILEYSRCRARTIRRTTMCRSITQTCWARKWWWKSTQTKPNPPYCHSPNIIRLNSISRRLSRPRPKSTWLARSSVRRASGRFWTNKTSGVTCKRTPDLNRTSAYIANCRSWDYHICNGTIERTPGNDRSCAPSAQRVSRDQTSYDTTSCSSMLAWLIFLDRSREVDRKRSAY